MEFQDLRRVGNGPHLVNFIFCSVHRLSVAFSQRYSESVLFEKLAMLILEPFENLFLMKLPLNYLTKCTEELTAYLEKTRAISPQMFEAEGLCGSCLGFYMVNEAHAWFDE